MKTIKELEDDLNEKEKIFFNVLKELFKEEEKLSHKPEFYYLILENKQLLNEIYSLIGDSYNDYSLYNFYMKFEFQFDLEDYNSYGIIKISIADCYSEFKLVLEQIEDMRANEFCVCVPSDKNYNHKHQCCEMVCDSFVPRFHLIKIESLGCRDWRNFQKDIWNLETEWELIITEKENEEENRRKLEKENQIKEYERNIQYYEKLKQELLNNSEF